MRLGLLLLLFPVAACAASFECRKAQSRVEKAICADAALSRLDEHLGRFYPAARERLAENGSCLAVDQRDWIRRRNACGDDACLKQAYLERLGELAALQPGMNLPNELELPRVPALAWAIATPEEMKGDPREPSRPFRVEGRLGWGCPECGYYVRNDAGKSYVMLGDMFLAGATATALPVVLETGKDARFAARGFLREREQSGQAYFDNQQCIYLYRLP